MSDIYEEILSQSNIQTVLEHYGLNIVRNKCICPFHSDNHPSLSIQPNKGIVKCFSCGAGGNTISFIQKYENEINHNPINLREAMQKAIDIQKLKITIPQRNNEPLTEEQKAKQEYSSILKDAITLTEKNLRLNNSESIKSMEYLKGRHLSDEIIRNFHIGLDSNQNTILSELSKKHNVNDLIELGIAKEYNGRNVDVFNNRITIPIFDQNGNPVGFGARTTLDTIKPKYLNTKANKLFDKSNLLFNYHQAKSYARNDEMIIVEGYMDVISSKAMGFDNVVGTMGTALTKEHIELLKKLKCEITLSLDNDSAGKDAMIRVIPELLNQNLKVNVLEIGKLGNYKDFGDLQVANIPREKIYQTKISAFTFLMQEKYIKDSNLTVENIYSIYKKMRDDGIIKTSKDIMNYKEVIMDKTNYNSEEIEKIINPTEINNNRVDRYKNVFFYHYITDIIKKYATKHEDITLLKFIEQGKLNVETMLTSLDNENYLKDDSLTINIGAYIRDYIYNTEDYKIFKGDKKIILEKLLNNVKSFDSNGNIINIELTLEQKQMVIDQYNNSFDSSIQNLIENNPNEFEELFIANNCNQFENLFPKSYVETMKEQAINRFKNDKVMEAVRYALAYSESMIPSLSEKYVKDGKLKTLLVFNNTQNILSLSTDNIKQTQKEETKEIEKATPKIEQEKPITKPMSIVIKLTGNEKETYKGLYLPVENDLQVFIPRELYKKEKSQLEILNNKANQANMSEYKVNNNEHTKKWLSRLTLDDFYHKYFKFYEIQMEKEVMPSASY
ncbi:MAG: DNA primase [Clostridia bacterium]|nr:DNA primase [Clostridia bacterium]